MADSLDDINVKIIRLKKLKFDYAHQKGILDVIDAELDEVKTDILETLKAAGALSYKTATGTVSVNRRQTVMPTNAPQVLAWMKQQGLETDSYLTLNTAMVKPLLEEAVLKNGEVIDGTEIRTTEYISLRSKQ